MSMVQDLIELVFHPERVVARRAVIRDASIHAFQTLVDTNARLADSVDENVRLTRTLNEALRSGKVEVTVVIDHSLLGQEDKDGRDNN